MKSYDLIIIGSGPGGYIAALYASRFKKSVCVIEKADLGGTCLNAGCIPTKALYESALMYEMARHAATFGVLFEKETLVEFSIAAKRKDEIVATLRKGVEFLINKSKATLYAGESRGYRSPRRISSTSPPPRARSR